MRFGRSVVKPAHGSHGSGVFIVEPSESNLGAAVDLLLDRGPVVVQPWIPEAVDGDIRLFVVDGKPLMVDGVLGALRRRPARGELRSNVHLGGRPEPVPPTPELLALAERAGPALMAQGARCVGLDCIGDRVVEANVCAPGGLTDMDRFYERPFLQTALDALLA